MRKSFGLIGLTLAALSFSAVAQIAAQTPAPPPQPDASSTVIHANTQLIVVDVIVEDKGGKPIHGLKAEDFRLTEGKTPQTLRHFEEHAATTPVEGPKLPQLPAGTFTDYTPVAPNGTLNILLLDALNTPMKDQSYVHDQLQQYVQHAPPGTRIAIFGLANSLILLQGFTADPQTLKDAVAHKLLPRSSNLLDDPGGTGVDALQGSDLIETSANPAPADAGLVQLSANLQQFEAESAALQTQLRIQYTLDGFNTLAHYLAAFPGRKNLIWFSASFPINILPDPSLQNSGVTLNLNSAEYRETVNLLSKAQVALYPIDARGLVTPTMYNAANSGRAYNPRNPGNFAAASNKFNTAQATEHSTMEDLASDTGGHASYNTNGIAEAVTNAVNSGANYYTLTYSPSDRKQDGQYRNIHLDLTGSLAAQNLQLSYRRGYYADDSEHKGTENATTSEAPRPGAQSNAAYQRAAMSRGAPAPQDLLFKVRVLPASTTIEKAAAPGNALDKSVPATGPFRRYAIDYVALPSAFKLTQQDTGRRTGQMEFLVYVFDTDGRLLNATGETIDLNLSPESYDRFLHTPIQRHLEVSVPTRTETFLRVGIEDVRANKFGVVELPVASISRLPPVVYATPPTTPAPAPAAPNPAPSNSPPPAPAPSTTPAAAPPSTPQR